MSGDVQLELWLHEYKMEALASVLNEQGTTVEKRMQGMLIDLYTELVPQEVRQEIRSRLDAERAAKLAEEESARKYTVFCVREDGAKSFFQMDRSESILEVAKFLRRYLREGQGTAALQTSAFARMEPVTAERYDQLLALRMEAPGKVTGVFDLDFDKQEVSTADTAEGWKTWSMQDVSTAIYHAYRKSHLRTERYMVRFLEKLEGKELPSSGHLSAKEVSLVDGIVEMDDQLNFCLGTGDDVRTVLGALVRLEGPDDWFNLYANYDCAGNQVCDALNVELHHADGRQEELTYPLNAAEKTVLRREMDSYCRQEARLSLEKYSAQLLTENLSPPTAPSM